MALNWHQMKITDEGREFELLYPDADGEPTGAFITVCSMDSKRGREWLAKKQRQNRNFNVGERQNALEMLVHLTMGWRGITNPDGSELEFSEVNARQLYTESPEVLIQATNFMTNRENFYSQD